MAIKTSRLIILFFIIVFEITVIFFLIISILSYSPVFLISGKAIFIKNPDEDIGLFDIEFLISSNDTELFSELKPNFTQLYDGVQEKLPTTIIEINDDGFRGPNVPINKSINEFRIIVLGDSVTFGLGVNYTDTYPYYLERKLNQLNNNKKYTILNFGVPSYNTLQEVRMFILKGKKYNPDLVILQYHPNDIDDQNEFSRLYKEIKGTKSLSKRDLIKFNYEFDTWYHYTYLSNKSKEELWSRIEIPLRNLYEHTKQNNIKVVIFVGADLLWDSQSLEIKKEYSKRLKALTEEYNWGFLYLSPEMFVYPRDKLVVGKRDGHPNAQGHKLIGEKIYSYLIRNKLVPF
jgi:lysophospholipase L1-like esterase